MDIINIIERKRDGYCLTKDEIYYFINGYTNASIPDYQISSLLMAIVLKGMSDDETYLLTKAMLESGEIIDLTAIEGIIVDKHSTGGVGDKTTLVLAPILASFDIAIAKMSGRGLGHTGGTLDKLEAIPNFKIDLCKEEFINQVNNIKLAVMGQTEDVAPADKKLYALRDVTGTVASIPLIASSIMSKKLASGADVIILDVKVGNGAFMKNINDAKLLAKTMVMIGKKFNKKVVSLITDMSAPLGSFVGNSLEVIEAVETLKGCGEENFTNLCISLCAEALVLTGKVENVKLASNMICDNINNGMALSKFMELVIAQKGDSSFINDYEKLPLAKNVFEIKSTLSGIVSKINALEIGMIAMDLGAGRKKKDDLIDYGVGIEIIKHIGSSLEIGDTICKVYSNDRLSEQEIKRCRKAFEVTKQSDECKQSIVFDIIR